SLKIVASAHFAVRLLARILCYSGSSNDSNFSSFRFLAKCVLLFMIEFRTIRFTSEFRTSRFVTNSAPWR
ncbi:hypothetical protein QWY97_17590, partial [Vibrio cortegadensis]|uniref:hypothetical protein n=1 Tax=Vibrio cortegadensis TaxID=1328770 RepID=UPI0025B3D46A